MDDWIAVLLVILVVGLFFLIIWGVNVGYDKVNICQTNGYTWRQMFAGTEYCIRIDDEGLIGVPLLMLE